MFGFASPKSLRAANVVGMNKRNYDVIVKYNKRSLYPLVDDKVQTKQLAAKFDINTPGLIGLIEHQYQVKDILSIIGEYKEFVVKPAHGSGGKGVLVIKDYRNGKFVTASGREMGYNELYQHISNVISGLYSLGGQYDVAIIEELVHFSSVFKGFSYQGIPDVRIIVYRGYPVMSMMRLSTEASGGRANLHQGAVGVGIDIQTGTALNAVMRNLPITHHPDTNVDLHKLVVPLWREHLEIATKAYEMTDLGYLGADIVLDEYRGPMMLELNARPGLAIQIANGIGISDRLAYIDKHRVPNATWEERLNFILERGVHE